MFRNSLRLCNSLRIRIHPLSGNVGLQYARSIAQSVVHLGNDVQTHYDVLGLPSSASQTQIRNAYLQLTKQELIRGGQSSKEKYARLKAAYDVLSDSTSRQEYDQQLGHITESSASSLQSHIRDKTLPSVDDPVRKLVGTAIYRKLAWESHKKVPHNMDIAPHICITFMLAVLLYVMIR